MLRFGLWAAISCPLLFPIIFFACGGGGGGGGSFSLDPVPALTNQSPHTFSGQKPKGHAVHVNGNEQVAADGLSDWQVALNLAEGQNELLFEAIDASGQASGSETVQITLDSTAPAVVSRFPAPNATDVALNTTVAITLSEPVDCASVNGATFAVQGVASTISCQTGSPTITLAPTANLAANTAYTVTLFSDVQDGAGNGLAADVGWQFTTGATVDDIPPDPPSADSPAPPQTTVLDAATVGGWKEAGANVISNGAEIVPADDLASWSHVFALVMGANDFSLTSQDAAGNVSTTSTDFTITRNVGAFTLDAHPAWVNATPHLFSGTKTAGYAVFVDGAEAVAAGPETTWQHQAALADGANNLQFEARDGTGATVATIAATIHLDTQPPSISQRNPGPNSQDVPLDTTVSVEFDEPVDCATVDTGSFSLQGVAATAGCSAGDPVISLTPLTALTESQPYTVTVAGTITDRAGNALGADVSWTFSTQSLPARLIVEFDLLDQWDTIGDEMYYRAVTRPAGPEMNHFGVDIWVEGPYQDGETCLFDDAAKQRLDTRYVATVSHGISQHCDPVAAPVPCSGWWNDSNYQVPNYLAALIEHGQWVNPTDPESGQQWPLPADTTRRDPASGEQWAAGATGNQASHPELHYPWQTPWGEWITRMKAIQQPYVDGLTEATIDSGQDPANGPPLGQWRVSKTYEWDLTDHAGIEVSPGKYLINVLPTIDRARKATGDTHLHYAHLLAMDRETCWDDPAHHVTGPHRAEGLILVGGGSKEVLYLKERGLPEFVDACGISNTHQYYGDGLITCDCQGSTVWPCPETPVDPARIGDPITYMDADKFADPLGDGQNYAVRITYCPPGTPCP